MFEFHLFVQIVVWEEKRVIRIMEEHYCCFYSKIVSKCSIGLFVFSLAIVLMVRVLYVIYRCGKPFPKGASSQSFSTLIVLGSGKKSLIRCSIRL